MRSTFGRFACKEFYTCDYKAAIERERSEARFDSAEREQARP
jgi:hypothetical protein